MGNENTLPKRKKNRLEKFSYHSCGAYFITVCTSKRRNYFWKTEVPVGATIGRPSDVALSPYGEIVNRAIGNIPIAYPSLSVESFVIMPDHFHALLCIHADENGRPLVAPTVSRVVQHLKSYVTKQIGMSIWQKSFYDHVIRNREDFEQHLLYIDSNPIRFHFAERNDK